MTKVMNNIAIDIQNKNFYKFVNGCKVPVPPRVKRKNVYLEKYKFFNILLILLYNYIQMSISENKRKNNKIKSLKK